MVVAKKVTTPMANLSEIKGLGTQNQTSSKTQMATTSQKQIETKDSTQTSKKTIGDDIDFYEEIEIDDSSEVDNDLDYTTQY
mgnify:CR=1 FL=1